MHFGIQTYIRKGTEATKETKSITLAAHKTLNSPPFDDHIIKRGVSRIYSLTCGCRAYQTKQKCEKIFLN